MNYTEIFEQRGEWYNRANELYPGARLPERQAFVNWLQPQADESFLVAAAGGGYDAVGIEEAVQPGMARIVCAEPSARFATQIPDRFEVLVTALAEVPIADESMDAVCCLAALHHIENRDEVYDEWMRVLKPGGRLVVADVEVDSQNGAFLNTCVNQCTPGGHDGVFLKPNELTDAFRARGCEDLKEATEDVSWQFEATEDAADFSWHLFGMVKAEKEEVLRHIEDYLPLREKAGGIEMPWSLRFFSARKP